MRVLLHLTNDDRSYVNFIKPIISQSAQATVSFAPVSTITELVMKAKEVGAEFIATTSLPLLKLLIPNVGKGVTIENYAGSVVSKFGMEFLIISPLQQLTTKSEGRFLARRYFSKFFKRDSWIKFPALTWKKYNQQDTDFWINQVENADFLSVDIETIIDDPQRKIDCVGFTCVNFAAWTFETCVVEFTYPDNITTLTNRVHGNYVASQRPIAFQGPIGQAVSLFQTYQVNLMQQMFRYVENGDVKSLAILGGLQTSLYGLNGLPGFQAINNNLIGNASGNPGHADLYSTIPNLIGKKLGDYLMYGGLSAVTQTGLYSRGDINPRSISVIPINPLDYPAISGGIRFFGNLLDTAGRIADGGDIGASLLMGMEHNSLSRPLAGLAQLAQGFITNESGQLISAVPRGLSDNTSGWNDFINIANFSRLAGARPLDEAIAMDATNRAQLYEQRDRTRINSLGEAFKTQLYASGGNVDADTVNGFVSSYAQAGGYQPSFAGFVVRSTQETTVAKSNQAFYHLNRPINQQTQQVMGGQMLPDFSTRVPSSGTQLMNTSVGSDNQ